MAKFNSVDAQRPDKVGKAFKDAETFAAKVGDDLIYCIDEGRFYVWGEGRYNGLQKIEDDAYFHENEEITYLTPSQYEHFKKRLAMMTYKSLSDMNAGDMLNFQNGMLDVKTGKFGPHDKKYISTIQLPYKYDKDAKHPNWDYFLDSSLEGDKERIALIQEFIGYCLGKDNGFHKSLILLGDGRNGKGTTFRVIKQLIGDENFASLDVEAMTKEDRASMLVNKLVNIDADCNTLSKGFESIFRKVSAGDSITAKKLYHDVFTFTPYCKLIIGANELPRINDKTHGFYDRLIIIPYNVSFAGREDLDLDSKLEAEISGILNWALEGRKRLYEQRKFSITKSIAEYVNDLKIENNPLLLFVNHHVGFHEGKQTVKNDLYKCYRTFCGDNGYSPLSVIKFGKEFYRIAGLRTQKDEKTTDMNRTRIWPNVYIKDSLDDPDKTKVEGIIKWDD